MCHRHDIHWRILPGQELYRRLCCQRRFSGTGDGLFRSTRHHHRLLSGTPVDDIRRMHRVSARGLQTNGSRHTHPDVRMGAEEHDRQSGSFRICRRSGGAFCQRTHGLPACHHLYRCRRVGFRLRNIMGHVRHTHSYRGILLPGG